jgi:hypothetical protein
VDVRGRLALALILASLSACTSKKVEKAKEEAKKPIPLVTSKDSAAFRLDLPAGWSTKPPGKLALSASRGKATISVAGIGGPFSEDELLPRLQAAQRQAAANGVQLQGDVSRARLGPDQPLLFFKFSAGGSSYVNGMFTLRGQSYSIVMQGLEPDEVAYVGRSLALSASQP